jgi:hypothetical protein
MERKKLMRKTLKNKFNIRGKQSKIAVSIALLLMLSSLAVSMPIAIAHTPAWNVPTWLYLSSSNNPVKVNNPDILVGWMDKLPPTANGQYGDRFTNLRINVVNPDGTNTTIGPITSDPVGSFYTVWTPTVVGNYTIQAYYPGQLMTGQPLAPPSAGQNTAYINDTYLPSWSNVVKVAVDQTGQPLWQATPLPSGYWQRPIFGENREWSVLASDWLGGGSGTIFNNLQLNGQAPNTAHIVWTKPLVPGGIAEQTYFDKTYYDGLSYESEFRTPIIIDGKLIYNSPLPPLYGWTAVDLKTGQQQWYQNGSGYNINIPNVLWNGTNPPQGGAGGFANLYASPASSFGQVLFYSSPNQNGAYAYDWSSFTINGTSFWGMFDAMTGQWICNIYGIPSSSGGQFTASTILADEIGSVCIYQTNLANHWMAMWNSTLAIQNSYLSNGTANGYWMWRPPIGSTISSSLGWQWNYTLPPTFNGVTIPTNLAASGIDADKKVIIYSNQIGTLNQAVFPSPTTWQQAGISVDPKNPGQVLWVQSRPFPGNYTMTVSGFGSGYFGVNIKETQQWYLYNSLTGAQVWGPSPAQGVWDMYGMGGSIAYGHLFSTGYGGILYAYNLQTGTIDWKFNDNTAGTVQDSAYGQYPLTISAIADGKVYLTSSEHSPSKPLWRGSSLRAIDATNGTQLWKIDLWSGGGLLVADGYLVALNDYDGQIYTFGKGLSATTVSVPTTAVPMGTPVLIQGTVTDQSPGQTCLGIPAAGTPAIADSNMSAWMQYLYMQQSKPTTATGVKVHLTATDPNGNFQDLGTTTSDINGNYAFQYNPPVPGTYNIKASFDGTNSYFNSEGATYLLVTPAPSPAVKPTTAPTTVPTSIPTSVPTTSAPTSPSPSIAPPPTSGIPTVTYVAIAAAVIIIVVVAAAIALRRRK